MKILLAVLISLFSLDASAQWYRELPFWKKPQRLPQIVRSPAKPIETQPLSGAGFSKFETNLGRSSYSVHAEELSIMKNLQHSKRYGSDSVRVQFDNLANFYLKQNRFSEAKWYLLQSNSISRQHKDYEQIVGSLMVLADIKSNLGDFKQADADLAEAKNIAASHSLTPDLPLIEQHIRQIQLNKAVGLKAENRYSDLL